jgi:hypothetical protein
VLIAYPGGVLSNNILYGNGSLITFRGTNVDCDYNDFYDLPPYTGTPRFTIWSNWPAGSEVLFQSFASYKTASGGQDSHSIYADPLFVSSATSNFRLNAGSPAIQAGSFIANGNDFAGNPMANPPSIGAFEFVPATATIQSLVIRNATFY